MSIPVIVLTGTFRDAAGDPQSGTLSFRLNHDLVDSVGNVVSTRESITSTLNASGQITDTDGTTVGLTLYCTSGGDIAPSGLLYDVKVEVGDRPKGRVSVAIPSSLGATVDWADLVPVPSSTGVTWTVPDLTSEQAHDLVDTHVAVTAPITKTTDDPGDTLTLGISAATSGAAGSMSAADKAKLDGVATGATANSSDATLLARANHTGTQTASTISDFNSAAVAAGTGTFVPQDVSSLTSSSSPDLDDVLPVQVDGALRKVSLSDLGLGRQEQPVDSAGADVWAFPHEVISTFQSGHGWTLSNHHASSTTDDTVDYVLGSQSAKVVTTGVGTGTPARLTKTGLTLDLTKKQLRILVKMQNPTAFEGLFLYAGDSGFANYWWWELDKESVGPYLDANDWTWLTFDMVRAQSSGSPRKNAITDLRFAVYDDASGQVTMNIGAIALIPDGSVSHWPRGVVSFVWDDGYDTAYTLGRPILDQYLYPATILPIQDRMGVASFITLAQLRELHDDHGWEVGSHASTLTVHDNRFTALTAAQLEDEYRTMKAWLRANGFKQSDHVAYPGGVHDASIRAVTEKYYRSARTTFDFTPDTWPVADPMRMRTQQLNSGISLVNAKARVDGVLDSGGWLVFTLHRLHATTAGSQTWVTSDFQSLVDYIATKGVEVRTVRDVFAAKDLPGVREGRGRLIGSTTPPTLVATTNTTTESTVASITLPAKSVKPGDKFILEVVWDTLNNSGGSVNYTYRFKIGATTLATTGAQALGTSASRAYVVGRFTIEIVSLTEIRIGGGFEGGFAGSSFTGINTTHSARMAQRSTAEDFSTDKVLALTCQMGTAAATADFRPISCNLERVR